MRISVFSFFMLIILSSSDLYGQVDVKIKKSEFRHGRSGFAEAWKHVVTGNSYFLKKGIWYSRAYDEYRKAGTYNNSNAELNYKTGIAALLSDKKDEASVFLLKAVELKPDVAGDVLLMTGRALQYAGRYSDAAGPLTGYLESKVRKTKKQVEEAKRCLDACSSAVELLKDTARIEITNPGSNINSSSDDYSEVFSTTGDTILFASRRDLSEGTGNYRYPDSKPDENIYTSVRGSNGWDPAITAGKNLTTKFCETPLYLSKNGDSLYIYAGYERGGDILLARNKRDSWRKPGRLPFRINTRRAETSITISPEGDEAFFVSDGYRDRQGGKDIYFIRKDENGRWSKPKNAGSSINTPFDEESVRLSSGGDTLWFSSKGHNSIGGFDIFYSVRDSSGSWEPAVNAGYPLNTAWNELFYYPSAGHSGSFYFSSDRSGGEGGYDIYSGRKMTGLPAAPSKTEDAKTVQRDTVVIRDTVVVVKAPAEQPLQKENKENAGIFLTGKISDSDTHAPLLSKIDIIDPETGETVLTTASSDVDGTYRVKLPMKKDYMADVRSPGYLSELKPVKIAEDYQGESVDFNVSLNRVKVGRKVVLNNILFETGKAILSPGSYTELDHLVRILRDNPFMKIEISGHTDNTGSQALNLKLSGDRAKAVVEYLISKGVDRTRLTSVGYGPSQPVATNATPEGRAKNRRVEFKILEF